MKIFNKMWVIALLLFVWSFTTGTTEAAGPQPVGLGTSGNFVILAKSGVSTTGSTAVVGNIGLSPAAATFITGFGLTMDSLARPLAATKFEIRILKYETISNDKKLNAPNFT